jgi:hypothetical protein
MKKTLLIVVLGVAFLVGSLSASFAQTQASSIDKVKEKKYLAIVK